MTYNSLYINRGDKHVTSLVSITSAEKKKRTSRKKVKGTALVFRKKIKNDYKLFVGHVYSALPKVGKHLIRTTRSFLNVNYAEGKYVVSSNRGYKENARDFFAENVYRKCLPAIELIKSTDDADQKVNIYKTDYFSLDFIFSHTYGGEGVVFVTVVISCILSDDDLSFMRPYLVDEGANYLVKQLVNTFWNEKIIDPILDSTYEIKGTFNATGPVKLADGSLFYIPETLDKYDNRDEYLEKLQRTGSSPKSMMVLFDPRSEVLVQTNSKGEIENIILRGAMKLAQEDIKALLEKTVGQVIVNVKFPNSLYSIWDIRKTASKEIPNTDDDWNIPLHEYAKQGKLIPYLKLIKEEYANNRKNVKPSTYLSVMGVVQTILLNVKAYDKIKDKVEKKRLAFNSASKNNLPALSSLRDDLAFFPHQAEGLAKLDKAEEQAVLEVSTGGGKTLITICDIINLMIKGVVKRPLVIVPNTLIPNWIGEIHFFTGHKFNAFPLTTGTANNWSDSGDKEDIFAKLNSLAQQIQNAPLNTIFITTFSFLCLASSKFPWGGYEFPYVEWIKQIVNPDYVCIDESHLIKNPKSQRNLACMELRTVLYRRIMTGTLVSNNPADLVGQIAFLDPRALGDTKEFNARYGTSVDSYGKATGWKKDAAERIRYDLKNKLFYLRYTEKDWAAALPMIDYNYHLVEMSESQKKIYIDLVDETIKEIMSDPDLREAWLKFQEEFGDENSDFNYVPLLGKLARLEQYLTAPDKIDYVNKARSSADKRSPKIDKIDELIGQSLKAGYKCIVAVHYKHSAKHLMAYSKYKDVSVYYDASQKDNLAKFMTEKDTKVIFAVIQSITEGLNLQMADRIIVADIDWVPGKAKQLFARLYRPHIKKDPKTGKMVNMNEGKTVHIDFVLANNSADIVKFCFHTYKKLLNAQVMEESPIIPQYPPGLTQGNLTATYENLNAAVYMKGETDYNKWFVDQVEEYKRTKDFTVVKPTVKNTLPEEQIPTPWVVGMPLPPTADGMAFMQWLEENEMDSKDLRPHFPSLKNRYVKTEFGEAVIIGVRQKTVRVRDADGEKFTVNPRKLVMLNKIEVKIKRKAKEKEIVEEDNNISLYCILYNDIPTLVASLADEDSKKLKKIGFVDQGPYWYFKVKNKNAGKLLLTKLAKKYSIKKSSLDNANELISNMTRSTYTYEIPENLRMFQKIKHTKAKKGELKLYPMVEEGNVYLCVDKATHPSINLSKYMFKQSDGYMYYFGGTSSKIKAKVKEVEALGLTVDNVDELKADAKRLKIKL